MNRSWNHDHRFSNNVSCFKYFLFFYFTEILQTAYILICFRLISTMSYHDFYCSLQAEIDKLCCTK